MYFSIAISDFQQVTYLGIIHDTLEKIAPLHAATHIYVKYFIALSVIKITQNIYFNLSPFLPSDFLVINIWLSLVH